MGSIPTFVENLLFSIFRLHNMEWPYFYRRAEDHQDIFDEEWDERLMARTIRRLKPDFLESLRYIGVECLFTENSFYFASWYTSVTYPYRNLLFVRLYFIAFLAQRFVYFGVDDARWWAFENMLIHMYQYDS